MYELKKIGKVVTSKFVGTGPPFYKKKNLPGRGLTKVEKHWSRGSGSLNILQPLRPVQGCVRDSQLAAAAAAATTTTTTTTTTINNNNNNNNNNTCRYGWKHMILESQLHFHLIWI